jgi:hypothetical protein
MKSWKYFFNCLNCHYIFKENVIVSELPKLSICILCKEAGNMDIFGVKTMCEEGKTLQGKQHTSRLDVAFIMIKQSCQKQNVSNKN